jgi:hypothetical protein
MPYLFDRAIFNRKMGVIMAINEIRTYYEKLKDPRWQKKRLEIFERDEWTCQGCFEKNNTLHIHHKKYIQGLEPWEHANDTLITLCEECHEYETVHKKEALKNLTEILNSKFLAPEIKMLADTFKNIQIVHLPEVFVSALHNALTDQNEMIQLVERYFIKLKNNKKLTEAPQVIK